MKLLTMSVLIAIFGVASSLSFGVDAFSLPEMNSQGTTYSSAAHPNGIFVIEAYFDSCPYCNENASNVDALATKYASQQRVQVLDVGVDSDDASYQDWIDNHHPNHPVLKDADETLIGQLGTQGFPSTYVLDCKGNVVTSTEGVWGNQEQTQIENAIDQLLTQDCSATK